MVTSGSEIAKAGFRNEQEVCDKFNNWKTDADAQEWLQIMYYELDEIEYVHAEKIGQRGYKSDVNVSIHITVKRKKLTSVENIQIKLVSTQSGFNQVDKGRVKRYKDMWHITPEIERLLMYYDGELKPYKSNVRDPRRMFIDEFSEKEQKQLVEFFQKNIVMIVSDIIRGRGRFAAEWTMVIQKYGGYHWVLLAVNEALSIYLEDCQVRITQQGNIKLGSISLQRKGGDGGRDTANMLQFKANPMLLFTDETRKNSR